MSDPLAGPIEVRDEGSRRAFGVVCRHWVEVRGSGAIHLTEELDTAQHARLISKAPEMAELLKWAHDLIQRYADTHGELNDNDPQAYPFLNGEGGAGDVLNFIAGRGI